MWLLVVYVVLVFISLALLLIFNLNYQYWFILVLCQEMAINVFVLLNILYGWISRILLVSIGLKSTEKNFATSFNPAFFILLIIESFETLTKHSA